MSRAILLVVTLGLFAPAFAHAGNSNAEFVPDPKSVQRYGPAYRYPQAGWIVLHIEGEPYERGYQHGRLLSTEIAAHIRCFAATLSPKAPTEGWKLARGLVNALFVRRYEKEYLEEMRGIADGATAAGAKFDNRPIDLVDVVALNAWPEIDTLDSALDATPTGLEGIKFAQPEIKKMPSAPKPMRCSAFAATGPATADGKIVFGHITMFSLYPSSFYNVWIDVKPSQGHRVFMQSYPAGIQSGLDYYFNDAGILCCETTIAQTHFDITGLTVANRIRKALQYADTIDRAAEILLKENNGLYTNEWLLADIKTNEIAMFELGTHKSKLWRSSKNEWFGGAEGFYWGCNNTKDLQVRLETIPSVGDKPANAVFHPTDRDKTWLRLFNQYKGKIDADFGKLAFTTPPLCAWHSVDAKFTTTALAKDLKTWALFGPPLGRSWQPTPEERKNFPEIQALVGNPWAILHANPPAPANGKLIAAKDITSEARNEPVTEDGDDKGEDVPATQAAWHGTLLPKSDADIWLAAAFADYERIVSGELGSRRRRNKLKLDERERLAAALNQYRSGYLTAVRTAGDTPLAKIQSQHERDEWYRIASGKGVLLLHELRRQLSAAKFDETMDGFGRANAGKPVSSEEFQAYVNKESGKDWKSFFSIWTHWTNLPAISLAKNIDVRSDGKTFKVSGEILWEGAPATATGPNEWPIQPSEVDVVIQSDKSTTRKTVMLSGSNTSFTVETKDRPRRVMLDPDRLTANRLGGAFTVQSFLGELEKTLIVYGAADETPSNKEAAEVLQRAIIEQHSNFTVPIKSDREVTQDDLKSHHLLFIGRPDSNSVVDRCRDALPVTFGTRSFTVRGDSYAHAGSAVIAAAENPWSSRYSVVVVAGLGAASTLKTAPAMVQRSHPGAEVMVFPNGEQPRALVVPAKELVRELNGEIASRKAE
jgi:hypothetical protein